MSQVPLDRYLQQSSGSQIASQEAIASVVGQMLATAFEARDAQLQQIVNQVAAKLQQLEAAIGQVALAAQQQKLSPFEVAMKAITHFGDDEPEPAAQRCRAKGLAIMERWLDVALETSATGDGEPRREASPDGEAEAEAGAGEPRAQQSPPGDQEETVPAENG